MAGIGCCFSPTLSSRSNLQTPWLVCETHRKQTMTGKPLRRRNLEIKAVINYVSADEAKELVAVNGFTVLDVRDSKQFERAHIKSCHHVPLFIENKDNDLGTIIKRQAHNNFAGLFFGLAFTKPNPVFVESVKSRFSPESKLLLVCQEGLRLNALPLKVLPVRLSSWVLKSECSSSESDQPTSSETCSSLVHGPYTVPDPLVTWCPYYKTQS